MLPDFSNRDVIVGEVTEEEKLDETGDTLDDDDDDGDEQGRGDVDTDDTEGGGRDRHRPVSDTDTAGPARHIDDTD